MVKLKWASNEIGWFLSCPVYYRQFWNWFGRKVLLIPSNPIVPGVTMVSRPFPDSSPRRKIEQRGIPGIARTNNTPAIKTYSVHSTPSTTTRQKAWTCRQEFPTNQKAPKKK